MGGEMDDGVWRDEGRGIGYRERLWGGKGVLW